MWRSPGLDADSITRRLGDRHAGQPFRFVQIGANDGSLADPLHEMIVKHHWTGLLVEPLPHLFEQLKRNYAGVPGLRFEPSAVASAAGAMTMYRVTPRPDDPEWADALGTFDRSVIEAAVGIADLKERIETVEVPTLALSDLLAKHEIQRIDLLHTDTEGYDWEIIRQVDFGAAWSPRYILFEAKHLAPATWNEAETALVGAGYTVLSAGIDAFAYRD